MTSPTIQLYPGKSISFEKIKRILEKVEELQVAYNWPDESENTERIISAVEELLEEAKDLLEVYEDE